MTGSTESGAEAGTNTFTWTLRVYYEDTDLSGVVYHANYLKFFERARTEWLRALGFAQDALLRERGLAFTIAGIDVQFRKPARMDDELAVSVVPESLKRASFVLGQSLTRLGSGEVLAEARARCACVDAARFAPRPLPADIHARMRAG